MKHLKQKSGISKYFLSAATILVCYSLHAQTPNSSQDSINTYTLVNTLLKEGYENEMFPAISTALFQKDSITYYHYGSAKIESNVAVSRKTRFQLGSIGKLMAPLM